MSFLVSQTVVVLVDIMLRLALYHEPYAGEYEDGGDGLHALEHGETPVSYTHLTLPTNREV